MIIAVLAVLGLILGSFVNALVWRLKQQSVQKNPNAELSILTGRSVCPNCNHQLASFDLIPLLSYLLLGGKCRYCHQPISPQYPLVEALTATLFAASYIFWPLKLSHAANADWLVFSLWLLILTGLVALIVYDLKYMLLPNRIVYPLAAIAVLSGVIQIIQSTKPLHALINTVAAVLIGGGLFYIIFQVSSGKWIGGGDVKLGWVLGLIAGSPSKAFLLIFLATFIGSLVSVPLLLSGKLKRSSVIPFGPFLIAAIVLVQLFGQNIINWYQNLFVLPM
jgi:prepilin signal peptidase PulO-like enzyme (type II secretory pathway)